MRRGKLMATAISLLSWGVAAAQPPAPPPGPPSGGPQVMYALVPVAPGTTPPPGAIPAGTVVPASGCVSQAPTTFAPNTLAAGPGCADCQQGEAANLFPVATRPPVMWGEVEYVLWRLESVSLPPATLTLGSTADAIPGALGQPHTKVLQGNQDFNFERASGVRPSFGFALSDDHLMGIEAEGFVLELAIARQNFISDAGTGNTYLPYFDVNGNPQAFPFTVPGTIAGKSMVKADSRLWSAESNFFWGTEARTQNDVAFRAYLLLGVRYLDLADKVVVHYELWRIANTNIWAMGESDFSTRNQFVGGQVGVRLEAQWGAWAVEATGKVAGGNMHQVATVGGGPLISATGNPNTLLPGPFLAVPTNTGRQSDDSFTWVPEVGAKLRLDLGDYCAVSFGYSFIWIRDVLSPGDQMDPRLNTTQLPFNGPFTGPNVPAPRFVQSNAFARGFTAGIEFRY